MANPITKHLSIDTKTLRICSKCGKAGCLAKVCQSKKNATLTPPTTKKQLSTHVVTDQLPLEDGQVSTIHDTKGVKDKTDPLLIL